MSNALVSVIIVTYNRRAEVIECIDSVLKSSYSPIEIIVVDNSSTDGTAQELKQRYAGRVKLIASQVNLYAGGGRNLGAAEASGQYLLFIDSDNVIDKDMLKKMMFVLGENKNLNIGLSGPFNYYKCDPERLCWVNNNISLLTSITYFKGAGEIDRGQYNKYSVIRVGHIPNIFMIAKKLFLDLGKIDPDYVMHYEESDLAHRIRKLGYEVVLFPSAKSWHDIPLGRVVGHKSFKGSNPGVIYYVVRNRAYFMRKNSGGLKLLIFSIIFNNIFLVYHMLIILFYRKPRLLSLLFKGYWDGLFGHISKHR